MKVNPYQVKTHKDSEQNHAEMFLKLDIEVLFRKLLFRKLFDQLKNKPKARRPR
jgi:hypothetical protein